LGFAYFKNGQLDEAKKCKDKINTINKIQLNQSKSANNQPAEDISEFESETDPEEDSSDYSSDYIDNWTLVGLFIGGLFCFFIPFIGPLLVIFIVMISAYLVYKDAQDIGAGQAPESWSPLTLGILVLLFWIIALPVYIIKRRSIYEEGESYSSSEEKPSHTGTSRGPTPLMVIAIIVFAVVFIGVMAFALIALITPIPASYDYQNYVTPYQTPISKSYSTISPTQTPIPRDTTVDPGSTSLRLSSTGDDVVAFSASGSSLRLFNMKYSGGSNFIIWLKDSQGNRIDLLVNEIGSYSGKKSVKLSSGNYYLDVAASGPWSVEITPSVSAMAAITGTPLIFKGYGDDVISFTSTGTGLRIFTMKYSGGGNYIIWLKDSQGNNIDLLVNDIGSYNGKKSAKLTSGDYYLDITASGPWSIEINH
jgi:hypothetical protein